MAVRTCFPCILAVVLGACTGTAGPVTSTTDGMLPDLGQGEKPTASPPNDVVGQLGIQLPSIGLEAGEERFECWVFPLQVEGPSRIVGGGRLQTGPGLHHGNITTRPQSGEGVRRCEKSANASKLGGEASDILAGGAVLFASSTQIKGEEWQRFPDRMGFVVTENYEIVARMHYLNATSAPLEVAPQYTWYTVAESSVDNLLGPFAWALSEWEIPPLSNFEASSNCRIPKTMHVVQLLPHMHELGTSFFAGFNGGPYDQQRFLDSKGYDPEEGVLLQYKPAVDVSLGESVRWGCSWRNTHPKTIVEGIGDNEMCILFGYAYPYENAYSARATTTGCLMVVPPAPGSGAAPSGN